MGVIVFFVGCGEKQEQQPVNRTRLNRSLYPASTGRTISRTELDTLRAHKKMHNITRDEYWDGKGGVLANDYFDVWYPAGRATVTHGMYVFDNVMKARKQFASLFGRAPEERLVVRISTDLAEYEKMMGREFWHYSDLQADTLVYQPVWILVKRGLAGIALPHEYYQWAIGRTSRLGAPRWLEEGLASYLTEEGTILLGQLREFPEWNKDMSPKRIEAILDGEEEKGPTRTAYYRSFRMVQRLVDEFGENAVLNLVTLLGQGYSLHDAFRTAFNKGYDEALEIATDYSMDVFAQ
jgi:hypothetical protein